MPAFFMAFSAPLLPDVRNKAATSPRFRRKILFLFRAAAMNRSFSDPSVSIPPVAAAWRIQGHIKWHALAVILFLVLSALIPALATDTSTKAMAESWQLPDAWGETYTFPAAGKQAHVLVFWASWCPYCHKLMPKVEAFYEQLPKDKVEFLAINAWDSADPEAFMMAHDYRFPVLVHGEKIAPLYGIKAVPEVLVFDSDGQLVYRRQTGQSADEVATALEQAVDRLLNPAPAAATADAELPSSAESAPALDEVLEDFYAFAEPHGNAIAIQQIPVKDRARYLWVDTRSAEKFRRGHIPGAIHMEWREVYERRDELPRDREIILYCSGGVVAAQAMMGLKLAGFDNVHTLAGGYSRFLEYEQQRQTSEKEAARQK